MSCLERIVRQKKFGETLNASKDVLWYEERASSDAALTKPLEIENAHPTLLTCLYLGWLGANCAVVGIRKEEGAFRVSLHPGCMPLYGF